MENKYRIISRTFFQDNTLNREVKSGIQITAEADSLALENKMVAGSCIYLLDVLHSFRGQWFLLHSHAGTATLALYLADTIPLTAWNSDPVCVGFGLGTLGSSVKYVRLMVFFKGRKINILISTTFNIVIIFTSLTSLPHFVHMDTHFYIISSLSCCFRYHIYKVQWLLNIRLRLQLSLL